jgi:hypothetical protein
VPPGPASARSPVTGRGFLTVLDPQPAVATTKPRTKNAVQDRKLDLNMEQR